MHLIRNFALFTAPVWGIVLLILMLAAVGAKGSGGGGELLLAVGALLPFVFLPVLWTSNLLGAASKFILSIIYYGASCIVMFVFGWATIHHALGVV